MLKQSRETAKHGSSSPTESPEPGWNCPGTSFLRIEAPTQMSHKDSKPGISLSLQDLGLCLTYADPRSSLALWPEVLILRGLPAFVLRCHPVPQDSPN